MKFHATIFLMMVLLSLYTEHVIGSSFIIFNNLNHGHWLKIHCKSGDNNLGYHLRRPGRNYSSHFHENAWGTTLYWCHLLKGPNFKDKVVIEAYNGKTQSWGKVRWSVRETGIYEADREEKTAKFRYNWNGKV
ncbi:PREDICTED: pumilio homolog 15 [Camelina sativa]|uniref:S-protein homolog n=1 Tax=Camelina sativa TaxID=90675 RepID=A0ABM0XIX5_CAMSA|nr:PREDICTED: pumilio homolog 15 [Camelina sativa]